MSERACASCGTVNEADARFCEGCGTVLERTCGACGVAASATARFCRACGAALDGRAATAEGPTRKTVTVLFADLAGSTAFEENVDPETAREVIGQYHELLRSTVERHRAGVTKYIGDGFMAVWGVPEIGADDAEQAVEAAVELQERFIGLASRVAEVHGVSLALRVAVNTGEVVVGVDDADLVGDALNVGARLESECPHGRVVVGEETWRSTRGRHRYDPLGAVQVKGRTAPVRVYHWLAHQTETTDSVPFVGRTDELRRLHRIFDDTVASRTARLVTVTGDPGVGKTRLATVFVGALHDVRVIRARCAVEGTPALVPIVEMLRTRDLDADIPPDVAERDRILRDLTGMTAGVPGSVEETFWALRRYVEVLASDAPTVIVIDDIQWADTLLIDFVEHLTEWAQGAPVLIVALARPEIRETRPDLVTVGGWVSEALRLRGLEAAATAELAAKVLGGDELPSELLARLPSSTGGNPLFVRELVGMLVHDGVLVAKPEGWRLTVDVDAITVPPTIQALLASRLERLNPADRRVLEVASVIGTDFSPSAVAALAGQDAAHVTSALSRLRRMDLAEPSGIYAGDDPVWRFHHVLIRDVAYRRLLKSDRADLHERLAGWVQGGEANMAFESDEVVARHLEAAHGYRLDLGLRDEHTHSLALSSAHNYLASARRALDRDELVSAGTQAARGARLAVADAALQAELLLVGCEALLSAGDVAAGAPLVDDLERIAGEALSPWAICYRCQLLVYTDPTRLPEVDELLQGAIEEFARREELAGLAKAHRVRANARARLGRVGDCELDLFEALIAARQGGDHRQITAALGAAPNAALWGPSPAPKAGGRCLDVVRMQRMTVTAPSLEATSLRCLAVLELLRGRPDKARTMLADARQVVADLGLRHGLMETELFAGIIELMVGDAVAAEPHFRTALEGLDALGVGADAGQAAALLARSVLAQGRIDEADRYAAESERIAGHNLKTAIAWRAVRAEILSARGRHDEAIALGRDAVAVAADTDLVLDHAEACLALSRVLAAAGHESASATAQSEAQGLFAAKDAVFMVGRAADPLPAATRESLSPGLRTSRLVVGNRATDVVGTGWRAMSDHDPDALVALYSDRVVYDDRRRLSGDPIQGIDQLREAARRNIVQYPHVEWSTLAVRGETLELDWARWWDDAGNEALTLHLYQIGGDGLIAYHGRFDEDDFDDAYREMENRYYAGEGAPFAESGRNACAWIEAMWLGDVEAARQVVRSEFRWLASATALKPAERSVDEFFEWLDERAQQVSSLRPWLATITWLSPNCAVALNEVRATGADGDEYRWDRIYVSEYHNGLAASVREFDTEDEDDAFAYAESLVAPRPSRLAVSNAASRVADQVFDAMRAGDAHAATAFRAPNLIYDDRRRLAGPLTAGIDHMTAANGVVVEQYSHFEHGTLAVRGERLWLGWSRWSDDDGNEAAHLHVAEIGDNGRLIYECFFDDDDFSAAYREMENRYYAGEGAPFATSGVGSAAWVQAIGNRDLEAARRACQPAFRWVATPSALKPSERTVDDMFRWMQERGRQVAHQRHWVPVLQWVSTTCSVGLVEIRAVGVDGEEYQWNSVFVAECRDGLLASVKEFDNEDSAFAYAEGLTTPGSRRLSLSNVASRVGDQVFDALRAGDSGAATALHSKDVIHDDRRRIAARPIAGLDELAASLRLVVAQYSHFEVRTLAVRGERLALGWSRWSDGTGNQAANLHVIEIGADGLISYEGRFDEEDFDTAYHELERRYYAGEGKPYAEGATLIEMVLAENRGDLNGTFSVFLHPGLQIESRSRSVFPTRTAEELRRSVEELGAMVTSYRVWSPAYYWLSDSWVVARHEREAIGREGETFTWARLYVGEIRDGLFTSLCEFDVDDEDAAFAYAEEQMKATTSRLPVANRATAVGQRFISALHDADLDAAAAVYSDDVVYDDRRRLGGDPISGASAVRAALERFTQHYKRYELKTVAVRGDHLQLAYHRWSDDAGNQTTGYIVAEIGDDGRVTYDSRFDEDDFESAYVELERRFYAGEGAPYAEAGASLIQLALAETRGDLDGAFRMFSLPGLRIESRSRSLFPSRTAEELRRSLEELGAMVASYRVWSSANCWLSSHWVVARHEREAVGRAGETFSWARLYAAEIKNGLFTSLCEFDVDDEDAAFAYAEERMQAASSRLAVSNRASEAGEALMAALRARDADRVVERFANDFIYDDRRPLSGGPISNLDEMRTAAVRIFAQYSQFEGRVLAVRGDRLALGWSLWSDYAGNEAAHLHLVGVDEHGLVNYQARFGEDDFDNAFRELEKRYYAGEGAAFAESGKTATAVMIAGNSGDFDKLFGELAAPGLRVESRSRTVFPDRTAAELRDSVELFRAMVSSSRTWYSAVQWLSPHCAVARQEREAVGNDGERYEWSRIYVAEFEHGLYTAICEFDVEFEEQAFDYAEERMRAASSRLVMANRASQASTRILAALRAGNIDEVADAYAEQFVYDDRRRFSAEPITDRAGMRAASERMRNHYNHFDINTLAVRGERLHLAHYHCFDDSGNQATGLILNEFDDSGLIVYEGRFDEVDFDSAYRELEDRYYSGEGRDFARNGQTTVTFVTAMDSLDVDAARRVCLPTFRWFTPPSTLVAQERSLDEFFDWLRERADQVASVRNFSSVIRWLSPACFVALGDVQARGTDGGEYAWARIYVGELRDGLFASMRQFEDEEAAFAYAESLVAPKPRRLVTANAASRVADLVLEALQANDARGAIDQFSAGAVYENKAGFAGALTAHGVDYLREAIPALMADYNNFQGSVLAVRGDRLCLARNRWSDDSGNETANLNVLELGEDGRITRYLYFADDDFDTAYRELEARYYSGEGAEFVAGGRIVVGFQEAMDRLDVGAARRVCLPTFRFFAPPTTFTAQERSLEEFFEWLKQRASQVSSVKNLGSVIQWLSHTCFVVLGEVWATGVDGEQYAWARIYVGELRDGLLASMRQFEDEETALAYAEERLRVAATRLAVSNRASVTAGRLLAGMQSHDEEAILSVVSDDISFHDHRRLSGDPIHGKGDARVAMQRILGQFNRFELRMLAVRGDRLALYLSRWFDDSGNETTYLHVVEVGDDGRIVTEARFDEDDFNGAYRELEARYYQGEGADFASSGMAMAQYLDTKNRGELDTLFGELSTPDVHIESRSRSVFLDRSAAEYRASLEELNRLVGSVREWLSTIRWMSPRWFVARIEREAVGHEGEQYEWTRIVVGEVRNGRLASACQFDIDDEDAAFAYAEEKVRSESSTLQVSNQASEKAASVIRAMQAGDVDTVLACYSDDYAFDDRRRLSGDPFSGKAALRAVSERILQQFDSFDWHILAVRGDHLSFGRSRWSDAAGNETCYLHVFEVGDDGLVTRDIRFDEDDFDGAYRELESRYYAGEGATFAEYGEFNAEYVMTMNRGDFDTMFNELSWPNLRVENRSRSVFPDRSAADLRASFEELYSMVASVRTWFSAIHWLSPTVYLGRLQREAVGRDGEQYAWTRILVNQLHAGRLASICDFDAEDETAALAYAEELARQT